MGWLIWWIKHLKCVVFITRFPVCNADYDSCYTPHNVSLAPLHSTLLHSTLFHSVQLIIIILLIFAVWLKCSRSARRRWRWQRKMCKFRNFDTCELFPHHQLMDGTTNMNWRHSFRVQFNVKFPSCDIIMKRNKNNKQLLYAITFIESIFCC